MKNKTFDARITETQIVRDGWSREDMKIVFAGDCVVCHRHTYQIESEDGHRYDPDPRGVIGANNSSASFVAAEYEMTGKDIPCCFDCANTRNSYDKALAIAKSNWK